jgi:UDP-N-acetylglucosamine/UDP-N-acetylgalactosamine diphosphorylase
VFNRFHIAKKKIGVVTDDGASTVTPSAENGVKMEMFVFDVFPFADLQHTYAFQVRRDEEFSPVKNAPGASACTAQTACQDVFALHARWLRAAGAVVDENSQVELSAAISYAGEGMQALNGVAVKSPLFLRAL